MKLLSFFWRSDDQKDLRVHANNPSNFLTHPSYLPALAPYPFIFELTHYSFFLTADIWTTRCTRCPAALDKLNEMAATSTPDDDNIQFVSICCDKLDGAREILERDDTPRWNSMRHFFMDHEHKERAKKLLGFKQVPFYIVFDATGGMVFTGGKLPDLDELLNKKKEALPSSPPPTAKTTSQVGSSSPNDVFVVDDLDF